MLTEVRFIGHPSQWGITAPFEQPYADTLIPYTWQQKCPYLRKFEFTYDGVTYDLNQIRPAPPINYGAVTSCTSIDFINWEVHTKQVGRYVNSNGVSFVSDLCEDFTKPKEGFPYPVGSGEPLLFSDWVGSSDINDPTWNDADYDTTLGIGYCSTQRPYDCIDGSFTCDDINSQGIAEATHRHLRALVDFDGQTYTYTMRQACCGFAGGTASASKHILPSLCANGICDCSKQRLPGEYVAVTAFHRATTTEDQDVFTIAIGLCSQKMIEEKLFLVCCQIKINLKM